MLVSLYVQEGHRNQETVRKARPHILPGTEARRVVTGGSISEAKVSQTQGQCGVESTGTSNNSRKEMDTCM